MGPFAIQPNNTTRRFEYPWAFHATPLDAGMRVLEIGGGLSGFQFALDRHGCAVVNIDPGLEAKGIGWRCDNASMARLNQLFGTSVELRNTVISDAQLAPESFDRAFSVSVLEHLPDRDCMRYAYDCLRPGGYFVLTVDLFLNVAPFTSKLSNKYGKNVSIKWLTELAPFELAQGNRRELYGFSEFNPEHILCGLEKYFIGSYPALVQCVVLRKPTRSGDL